MFKSSGYSDEIKVLTNSNCHWKISSNSDWVLLDNGSSFEGYGKSGLKSFVINPNTYTYSRTCKIITNVDDEEVHYLKEIEIKQEQSDKNIYNVGDIAYYSNTSNKIEFIPYTKWDSTFGTPVAVCVKPSHHYNNNEKAAFMSVNYAEKKWIKGNDVDWIYYFKSIPTWDNNNNHSYVDANNSFTCLSSDEFNNVQNIIDTKTWYRNTPGITKTIPSPYDENENVYSNFSRELTNGNIFNQTVEKFAHDEILNRKKQHLELNFPAAEYCNSYSTIGTKSGDWFLPTLNLLAYMIVRRSIINSAIYKCTGNELEDSIYSANEYDISNTYIMDWEWPTVWPKTKEVAVYPFIYFK